METVTETETERAERIQKWRLHRALTEAPDLLAHVRSIAVSGRSERGEVLGEWTAPMRITAADDADVVYGQLIDWVVYAAEELHVAPASVSVIAWSVDEQVHGFRAETTIESARMLTSIHSGWMLTHTEQLEAWSNYETFRDDVLDMLWRLRARYPMTQRRERSTADRVCPACGEQAVSASWWSEEMRDVEVSCAQCGFQLEAEAKIRMGNKRVGVLDLLDWETRENRDCTCRYPGDPVSECSVHHPDGVDNIGSWPSDTQTRLLLSRPSACSPPSRGANKSPRSTGPRSGTAALPASEPSAGRALTVEATVESDLRPGEVVCESCFIVKPCPCEDGQ